MGNKLLILKYIKIEFYSQCTNFLQLDYGIEIFQEHKQWIQWHTHPAPMNKKIQLTANCICASLAFLSDCAILPTCRLRTTLLQRHGMANLLKIASRLAIMCAVGSGYRNREQHNAPSWRKVETTLNSLLFPATHYHLRALNLAEYLVSQRSNMIDLHNVAYKKLLSRHIN